MDLKIEQLTSPDSPAFKKLVEWHYNWWGKYSNSSRESVETFCKSALCRDKIPQTYIALLNGEVVGSFQFCMSDEIWTRPDIYPWLCNVYTDEKYRGKGICAKMMEHVKPIAKKLLIKELYLHTSHVGLYEKYGWQFVEMLDTYGASDAQQKRLYKLTI
jgi:GNAT superfamily N-acetyltransferase